MAVNFDFVETDSEKIYNAIIGSLMENCAEPLYPGDERRIFGEALVSLFVSLYSEFNDKMKQRTLDGARGVVLDAIGARYNIKRADPSAALATFRFTVSAVQQENIIIPAGTRITTDGSVYFATTEAAVLYATNSFVDTVGVCTAGGAKYNGFTVGAVATIVDLIPYIAGATNITVSKGGDDGEPYTTDGDNKFRERIRLAPATQSTAGAENSYRYYALSADPDIIDVEFECPENEPNTIKVYPLMTGGVVPDTAALDKVKAVLSADDIRPMTDKVVVQAPAQVQYSINIKYYCTKDDESATIEAIEGDGGAIDKFIAWQQAALGRDINPDQLRRFILAPDSGVGALRVDVTSPTLVALTKYQVAKLSGTPTITHEIIS